MFIVSRYHGNILHVLLCHEKIKETGRREREENDNDNDNENKKENEKVKGERDKKKVAKQNEQALYHEKRVLQPKKDDATWNLSELNQKREREAWRLSSKREREKEGLREYIGKQKDGTRREEDSG